MAVTLLSATTMMAHGQPPKEIAELVGTASTGSDDISVALMRSPAGWTEPAQVTDFDETTVVVEGVLTVHTDAGTIDVPAGSGVHVPAGERVRYATAEPATYVAICRPAFRPDRLRRDPVG